MEGLRERWTEWQQQAKALKRELYAVYLASRDPRTPWYAKLLAVAILAYAASPIDLIPDPIPVLGYLDDMVLLPLGIVLLRRLIPPAVLTDARAHTQTVQGAGAGWAAALVIVVVWIVVLGLTGRWIYGLFR